MKNDECEMTPLEQCELAYAAGRTGSQRWQNLLRVHAAMALIGLGHTADTISEVGTHSGGADSVTLVSANGAWPESIWVSADGMILHGCAYFHEASGKVLRQKFSPPVCRT